MMRMLYRYIVVVILVLACPIYIFAQTPQSLELQVESISETIDDEQADLTEIAENLALLRENPININNTDKRELAQLPFLNPFQIHNLLSYIRRHGAILSPYELLSVAGFDLQTAQEITDYIYFGTMLEKRTTWKQMFTYPKQNLILRWDRGLEEREGYRRHRELRQTGNDPGSHYLGDPNRFLMRYRLAFSKHIQFAITAEKDPGEAWFNHPLGPDFLSAHLAIRDVGIVKSWIIGDFQAQFGQGLSLWTSLAFNKSAQTLNTQRFARGVFGSTGVDENRYMRGTAITLDLLNFEVTAFYSRKHVDASRNSDGSFASLQQSGLHRTPSEVLARKALGIHTYGFNLRRDFQRLSLGFSMVQHRLDSELVPSEQLFRVNQFRGNVNSMKSVDYQWTWRGLQFFGEVAGNERGGFATVNGAYIQAAPTLSLNIHQRYQSRVYDALYIAPFGVASRGGSGERGVYTGIEWLHSSMFSSNAYVDYYAFSWLRFHSVAPSRGRDYLWQTQAQFNRRTSAYARFRWHEREINSRAETYIREVVPERRASLRIHLDYLQDANWRFASRVEGSHYHFEDQTQWGILLFQDVRYTHARIPLTFTARYAFFDTDGFDSRIYAYEHDVLYGFSVPAYFNSGRRFYGILKWEVGSKLSFWLRFSRTTFDQTSQISSGLQAIQGNRQTEVRVQMRLKL